MIDSAPATPPPASGGEHDKGATPWLLLAVCGLCYLAQTFIAWGWPALDGYPAIERWIDPNFLPGDFYSNTTVGYGVDTWQGAVFGTVQQWTGVHYTVQLAALTALRCLLWPIVLYFFLNALLRDAFAARVGVVLGVFAGFALPETLGWQWLWGDASPAMFAVFAMTWAWTLMLQRRAAPGFVILAFATLFQPLVGVHGMIFASLIWLVDYDRDEKLAIFRQPATMLAIALFGATFLSQWYLLSPAAADRLPVAEYLRILVWERHPTDFLPSRFDPQSVAAAAIGSLAVVLMAVREYRGMARGTLIAATLIAYALICLFGWIFVEIVPIRLVIDLIPYRTASVGAPIMLAVIAAVATRMVRERRWTVAALIAGACLATGAVGLRLHLPMEAGAAILLIAALALWLPPRLPTDGIGDAMARNYRLGWLPVIALLLAITAERVWSRHGAMVMPTVANQHPLYGWAKTQTPPDARFLVEQFSGDYRYVGAVSPQAMRLIGRRAVVASRDYPFRETAILPWYDSWRLGLNHGEPDFVDKATAAQLSAICRALPYDYVVRREPLPAGTLTEVKTFAPAHGIGELHVYSLQGACS
ncbi:MAG: hypothetical protein AB7U35_10715 [Sphingobium sp.]